MSRNLIIADDFTGANDTGMQLRRRGYRTKVLLGKPDDKKEDISYVIDTESRGLSEEEAYQKVRSSIEGVDFAQYKYIIKKVDSTLRGNVAAEIKAVDEVFRSELIIFMPALPDLKRTTEGAIHKLDGTPITETEIAKDPKKPVLEDNIHEMLKAVYDEEVIHIYLQDIEADKIDFSSARVFSADAVNNQQMSKVIERAKETGKKVLYVGTAAMADNIFELETPTIPAMALIASVSQVTNNQIKYAEDCGVALVKISIPKLLEGKASIEDYVEEAKEILKRNKDVIVLSSASYDRKELERTTEAAAKRGMHVQEASWWTQKAMGQVGQKIVDGARLSGVFLTGGDTAIGFLEMLEANGAEIIGEIATGIPMMRLTGENCTGLKLVTKAGAFGNQDAIVYSLRKLKE